MQQLALAAIRFYQRRLSRHKGYCCAYRYHTGRAGCSELGFRAIRRYGLGRGLAVLRARLGRCGIAHRRYTRRGPALGAQAGFCDAGCDLPCDLDLSNACDIAGELLPGDCGGAERKRDDDAAHLPPPAARRPD